MNKQSLVFILIIFVILEFFNISIFYLDESFPTYAYNQIYTIKIINLSSVFLDLGLITILIIKIKVANSKPNKLNLVLILLLIIGLFLIWGEIIYSAINYYGGIGNHQGLPTDANNLGMIGSVIIIQCFIVLILNKLISTNLKRMIWNFTLFILNVLIHYQLFKLFTTV